VESRAEAGAASTWPPPRGGYSSWLVATSFQLGSRDFGLRAKVHSSAMVFTWSALPFDQRAVLVARGGHDFGMEAHVTLALRLSRSASEISILGRPTKVKSTFWLAASRSAMACSKPS
jgi:hypothetical protein